MCNQTGNPVYDGYGVINKALWGHKAFRKLPGAGAKLLFIYLLAGPETEPSGLFDVSYASLDSVAPHVNLEDLFPLVKFDVIEHHGLNPVAFRVWVRGMYEGIKDVGVRLQADEQVRMLPASKLREEFMRHNKIDSAIATTTLNFGMVEAISSVTAVDPLQMSVDDIRRINNLEGATYTAEDVLRVYSQPDGLWYTNDWRGQKGQRPTLTSIEKTIGSLLEQEPVEAKAKVPREAVLETVLKAQRKGMTTKAAREMITGEFGEPVWKALMARSSWRTWLMLENAPTRQRIIFEVFK